MFLITTILDLDCILHRWEYLLIIYFHFLNIVFVISKSEFMMIAVARRTLMETIKT